MAAAATAATPIVTTISTRLRLAAAALAEAKQPAYRLKQLCAGLFSQGATTYDAIEPLPVATRQLLTHSLGSRVLTIAPVHSSVSSQAEKVLFELHDGHRIEAVYMKFRGGHTSVCISSQAGCALACSFCATGRVGIKRQLTADEITDQILHFRQRQQHVDSISFMGMGEPLANPAIFHALAQLTEPSMFGMSPRRLSVSTVGVIPAIRKLTELFPQVNLAFSLHSPFEEQRSAIMPINKVHPLPAVFEALDERIAATNRKIFIAYLMLDGVNDSDDHARAVADWVHHKRPANARHLYHVNLLRYNPMNEELLMQPPQLASQASSEQQEPYVRSDEENLQRFMTQLQRYGVEHITARQSFGVDIDAACGQLYAKYERKRMKST